MPAISNIVALDRATTPVNHTYTPFARSSDGVFEWHEVTGVPIGDKKITIQTRKTAAGRYQTKMKHSAPIVQTSTVNGVAIPVLVRTAYADITLTFDATSTIEERMNFTAKTKALLDDVQNAWLVNNVVANGEGMF